MMASGMKRKLSVLSLEERISVINESKKGKSQRELSRLFNCGKTQIQNTLANQGRYTKEWEENKDSKKGKWQPFDEVNKAVLEWFFRDRSKGLPISGRILKEKARKFATDFGIKNFNASNGWLDNFLTRHNIVFREVCGESADVNELCEIVKEVDSSGVKEEIECFHVKENWDVFIAELNAQHECGASEELRDKIVPIDLSDVLSSIAKHRALANELGNKKLLDLFAEVEREYESVIINKRLEKYAHMPIERFLRKDSVS